MSGCEKKNARVNKIRDTEIIKSFACRWKGSKLNSMNVLMITHFTRKLLCFLWVSHIWEHLLSVCKNFLIIFFFQPIEYFLPSFLSSYYSQEYEKKKKNYRSVANIMIPGGKIFISLLWNIVMTIYHIISFVWRDMINFFNNIHFQRLCGVIYNKIFNVFI